MFARCLETVRAELRVKARLQRNKINKNMHERKNMKRIYNVHNENNENIKKTKLHQL